MTAGDPEQRNALRAALRYEPEKAALPQDPPSPEPGPSLTTTIEVRKQAEEGFTLQPGEGTLKGTFRLLWSLLTFLVAWLEFLAQLFGAMTHPRRRQTHPWMLRIGRREAKKALSQEEIERLLQRHQDLQDLEKIAGVASRYHLPESDFFADPKQVGRLIRRFLEENPPWLRVSRVLSGDDEGAATSEQEVLWREQEIREVQEVTLFIPDEFWRDKPLASMTMRPARGLHEVWQARLLDQILPPEVLVDRTSRGEILISVRNPQKQRLEFKPEQRTMEVTVRKPIAVPIQLHGQSGRGGQLLYVLLDYSASMQGHRAVLAMSVIAAMFRANMGQRQTRYLFRRYADKDLIWPPVIEPPLQARTIPEKDALLDTIIATNFNGRATHVNDALEIAVTDVEHLRQEEHLEASILLVTDGQAEMLDSTRRRLEEARVKVHTVMVTPEPNPSLERMSESFTALDIGPDVPKATTSTPVAADTPRPLQRYRV